MHISSYNEMAKFFKDFLPVPDYSDILDVGSRRIKKQRTYFDCLKEQGYYPSYCSYTGIDSSEGPNVDIIIDPTQYLGNQLASRYDVIISGQTLEHVDNLYQFIQSIVLAAKPGCLFCLIAPGAGPVHWGKDYWRILPDGMATLFTWGGITPLTIYQNNILPWCDTVGIGRLATE